MYFFIFSYILAFAIVRGWSGRGNVILAWFYICCSGYKFYFIYVFIIFYFFLR